MKKHWIHIVISEDLKNKLQEEAKEKNISLNAYIRLILSSRKK